MRTVTCETKKTAQSFRAVFATTQRLGGKPIRHTGVVGKGDGETKIRMPRKILFQEVCVRIYFLGSEAGDVSRVTSERDY